jgi:hypothetical protein
MSKKKGSTNTSSSTPTTRTKAKARPAAQLLQKRVEKLGAGLTKLEGLLAKGLLGGTEIATAQAAMNDIMIILSSLPDDWKFPTKGKGKAPTLFEAGALVRIKERVMDRYQGRMPSVEALEVVDDKGRKDYVKCLSGGALYFLPHAHVELDVVA